MPSFAANISMMFTEWPFLERFGAAADAGFKAVECQFPYQWPADAIAAQLDRQGLTLALFNVHPGDWQAGDRGHAAFAARFAERRQAVRNAIDYAVATGCRQLHLMAGATSRSNPAAVGAYRDSLKETAGVLAEHHIDLLIEPINQRDMPGYFLDDYGFAQTLIRELALPNLKLQFDCYHRQILHGDVTMALRELLPLIGHIQIASVPGRNEPDGEELDYRHLFAQIDRLGYAGWIGCEYRPRRSTLEGLTWFAPFRPA